ncbi:TIGR01777 family oxidoreductase [Marinobacter sp. JSM 1782161]|uniref:TIGR01777 family oxidoreductase n=1 Tax=Marinobacter sp. JSM 1782161 TaxID=2685906 RepID=UPI001401C11E|nr:TIGR01777 family oxidoreductase [Marinobacter sp. JSM 1782161]
MIQHILVTGGTGFIGQRLCPELLERGYRLTILSRRDDAEVRARCGRVNSIQSTEAVLDLDDIHAVINLAGEGIAEGRWTEARKRALRDSRIALTHALIDALEQRTQRPDIFVSGSAVGYYGSHGGEAVTEDAPPRDEFTHQLCADWEAAARRAEAWGARVCLSRTGVVLDRDGGAMARLLLPFRLGLGGRLGDGQQYMPWIHREDVVQALIWMLESSDASGPYNVVSPHPVTNKAFTRAMGKALHRPTLFTVPAFALRAAMGEQAVLLLEGQRALPARLQQTQFEFRYPELEDALHQIV